MKEVIRLNNLSLKHNNGYYTISEVIVSGEGREYEANTKTSPTLEKAAERLVSLDVDRNLATQSCEEVRAFYEMKESKAYLAIKEQRNKRSGK